MANEDISVEGLVPELFEAAVGLLPWQPVLGRVAQWLGARRVDLIGVADEDGVVEFRHVGHLPDAMPDAVGAPLAPVRDMTQSDPLVCAVRAAMPAERWHGLSLQREFMLHGDGIYFTALPVLVEAGRTVAMIVLSDDSEAPLQDDRSRRMRLIRAQLRRAMRVAGQVALGEAESRLRKQMVDVIDHPMILIDPRRRVLDGNAAGLEYLSAPGGPLVGDRVLGCRLPADDEALRCALERLFERGTRILRATVSLRLGDAADGAPVALMLIAVGDVARPRAVVVVHPIGMAVPVDYRLLGSAFGLTLAEARVADMLLQGSTPRAVAERSFVSMTTVRSHLKSLFAKTACRRQADLVRIVSMLPRLRVQPLDELRRRRAVADTGRARPARTLRVG